MSGGKLGNETFFSVVSIRISASSLDESNFFGYDTGEEASCEIQRKILFLSAQYIHFSENFNGTERVFHSSKVLLGPGTNKVRAGP
jgi:hypothetical protein